MRKLDFSRQASKSLEKLIMRAPAIARIIATQVEILRENPTPQYSTKKVGFPCYRARVGSYRIVYEFDDENLLVTIVEKRSRVYRKMRKKYS